MFVKVALYSRRGMVWWFCSSTDPGDSSSREEIREATGVVDVVLAAGKGERWVF